MSDWTEALADAAEDQRHANAQSASRDAKGRRLVDPIHVHWKYGDQCAACGGGCGRDGTCDFYGEAFACDGCNAVKHGEELRLAVAGCSGCGGAPLVCKDHVYGFVVTCADCYDGPGSPIGHGKTRKAALEDWADAVDAEPAWHCVDCLEAA